MKITLNFDRLESRNLLSPVSGNLPDVELPAVAELQEEIDRRDADAMIIEGLRDQFMQDMENMAPPMNIPAGGPGLDSPAVAEPTVLDNILNAIDSAIEAAADADIPLFHP